MTSMAKSFSVTPPCFDYRCGNKIFSNQIAIPSRIEHSPSSQLLLTLKGPRNTPTFLPIVRAQSSPDYMPDADFYKVEAIIRPWRIQAVSSALLKIGIRGVTVSDVRGFGAQGGSTERYAASEFTEDKFVSKVKMEIVVSKSQVDSVIKAVTGEARTGEIGDGKIFLSPVSDVIRVRTGERGEKAQRRMGGGKN